MRADRWMLCACEGSHNVDISTTRPNIPNGKVLVKLLCAIEPVPRKRREWGESTHPRRAQLETQGRECEALFIQVNLAHIKLKLVTSATFHLERSWLNFFACANLRMEKHDLARAITRARPHRARPGALPRTSRCLANVQGRDGYAGRPEANRAKKIP